MGALSSTVVNRDRKILINKFEAVRYNVCLTAVVKRPVCVNANGMY